MKRLHNYFFGLLTCCIIGLLFNPITRPQQENLKADCPFTWEVAGFGRLGNELSMILIAYLYSLKYRCNFYIPPLKIGNNRVNFSDIYSINNHNNQIPALQLDAIPLWNWGIWSVHLGIWSEDRRLIQASRYYSSVSFELPFIDGDYVGLHLRGEDFKVQCEDGLLSMISTFFTCYTHDPVYLRSIIERVKSTENIDKVLVATNFPKDSEIVKALRSMEGVIIDCDLPVRDEEMRPIVSHLLLMRSKYFIGNWYSTYSKTIIAGRGFMKYEYLQSRTFGITPTRMMVYAWWIVCVILIALLLSYFYRNYAVAVLLLGYIGPFLENLFTVESYQGIYLPLLNYLQHGGSLWTVMVAAMIIIVVTIVIGLYWYVRKRRMYQALV